MFELSKYLLYTKDDFTNLSHINLSEVAFAYMEAFKRSQCIKADYNISQIKKLKNQEIEIENLKKQLEISNKKNIKYNKLIHRKLTFKERLTGKIVE